MWRPCSATSGAPGFAALVGFWFELLLTVALLAPMSCIPLLSRLSVSASLPRVRVAVGLVGLAAILTVAPLSANPLQKVVGTMNSSTFRASVNVRSGGSSFSGTLSYSGGKMNFRTGDGRVVASNGRKIFAFDPASHTMGRQDAGGGGGGLGWILSYNARIEGNRAILTPTSAGQAYEEVRLNWDDGYFLKSISMKGKGGDVISIKFNSVSRVASLPVGVFSFKPPPGSRTVDNPLNQRN